MDLDLQYTSQQVPNALFGATGAMANARGTMNNLIFGNKPYQHYGTICSGAPVGKMKLRSRLCRYIRMINPRHTDLHGDGCQS